MVITGTTPRGKGVTQPVAILSCNLVGKIRKRCGSLIRCNHQVGIVLIVAYDPGWRDHRFVAAVIGQVEHAADEGLVAGFHLCRTLLGCAQREAADDKAAFGADRDNDRIFDDLCLDEPQYLGTEVLWTIRPSESAPGNQATPQVHRLNASREYEDLDHRPGPGHPADRTTVNLE